MTQKLRKWSILLLSSIAVGVTIFNNFSQLFSTLHDAESNTKIIIGFVLCIIGGTLYMVLNLEDLGIKIG